MFVSGGRRFVPSLATLVVGHVYSIDSGMGGSYSVHYQGIKNGRHSFLRKKYCDTPRTTFAFTDDKVLTSDNIVVPDESYTEMLWDEERINDLRFNKLEDAYEAWFPPVKGSYSYKNLVKKGLIT